MARSAAANRGAASLIEEIMLRPRTAEDHELLGRLYGSTRADEMAIVPWSDEEKDQFLRMQFEAQTKHYDENYPNADFLVVELGGEAVGRLYLDCRPDETRIVDIALFPEYRKQGIGSALIAEVIEEASASGLPVRIHVEKNNPALALYRRFGFHEVDDVGVYWLMECPSPSVESNPVEDK